MKLRRFLALLSSLLFVFFILPQEINAQGLSIKVGAYSNAPKIFQDEEGSAAGFWPEIIAFISKNENWQVEYVWGTWSEGLDRLRSGEIDILPDVAVTESRKNLYDFSEETVLLSWSRLYIKDDTPTYNSIFDLNGKKIAVLKNSVNYEGQDGIKEIISSFDINCTFVEYQSYIDAFSAVNDGLAYASVANRNFGDTHENEYKLKKTSLVFQPINVNFAFPKNSTKTQVLISKIDNYIKRMKDETSSTYFQLLEKYFESGIAERRVFILPVWGKQLLSFLGVAFSISIIAAIIFRIKLKTSRKRIEQNLVQYNDSLRKSEERWKFALEGSAAGVWDWNVETNETFFSERWKNLLGYEKNEIGTSGEEWTKRVHPDDLVVANSEMQKHFQGEVPFYSFEHRMTCKDGTEKWFLGRGKVIAYTADGQPLRMVGTNTDITEHKQAEQEKKELEANLQQAYKMEAIGTLASGIAHDFNNMLAVIRGNVDTIQRKQKNGSPFDKNLEFINQSTSRAIDLVKQILAFSRQEKIELSPLDLPVVIEGSLRLLRSTIPSTVEIVSSVNETVLVNADATQLQQICINLCTNAVHAMEDKGLLTVTLHEVRLSAHEIPTSTNRQAGRYAKLTITDTGTGMDKETIARIFEPFFTTKSVGEGTGMGLSVVYGIVESHCGFITVESTLGQGTSFNIYFPTIGERRQKSEDTAMQVLPFGTERILFVDDEKGISSTCTEMLEYQGYKVTSATSSVEALAIFKGNPETFDLVFTDQTMPEMTGTELAAELLKIRPDIPIILCSGLAAITTEKDAKSIGIRKFCTKPMNEHQLALIVRNVLDDGPLS